MAKQQDKAKNLTWKTMIPESLPKQHLAAYNDYRAKMKVASDARKVFEDMVQKDAKPTLPEGKTIIFGYNYGQLSMGIGDTVAKSNGKTMSLSDFLSAAKVSGLSA